MAERNKATDGGEVGVRTLEPGTVIAHNYRVTKKLGAGGMGTVYLGENVTLAQQVVIKLLQTGVRGAGAEEARVLAALDHPNVVHVYAYDEPHDCIVMQHLKGRSLQELLEEPDPRLDFMSGLRILSQAATALAAVHERGVVHRDVKPDNLMLDFTGGEVKWVKLIDLGTALRHGRTIPNPTGTPQFCPPEQFEPDLGASPKNDVYALGATLFLLCAREYPYDGEGYALYLQHNEGPVPDLKGLLARRMQERNSPPFEPQLGFAVQQVSELIIRMMAKKPADRPEARDVAFALQGVVDRFAMQHTQVGFRAPVALTQVARTRTIALGRKRDLASGPTEVVKPPFEEKRSSRGAIVGAVVAVVAGVTFAMWPSAAPTAPAPAPVVVSPERQPQPQPLPTPVVVPVVVEAVPEVLPSPQPSPPPGEREKRRRAPSCTFDEPFVVYARGAVADLRKASGGGAKFDSLDDAVGEALVAKDCRRVLKGLSQMRKLAHVEEDE